MSDKQEVMLADAPGSLFQIRGERVILDADIAAFFDRKTGHVNELRSRNQLLFPEHYAFQLTREEWSDLKSQFAISTAHGGRRSIPWAYTEHGFAMLAMRMSGERAARIARAVIDTFVAYRRGTLPNERVLNGPAARTYRHRLQEGLYQQMEALLALEMPTGTSVSDELKTVTEAAIGRVKAVLDAPAKRNAQISAEIGKLEAETAKLFAEARKNNAEVASIQMDVFAKRLTLIQQLREMSAQLERDEVVDLLTDGFDNADMQKLPLPSQIAIASHDEA
ncbi:hypothetical protein GCM10007385_00710 [Tateyamaria omphalii]|uniref:ORF6N domain-containing protein n=1 Tax=Tateyamaria omphalii TaxID=299262 RepID=UPI001678483B|nr:ORF6N domain-containing protein [Tateyamaria omphalii]GGX37848.1 hypothetical protein GCM10007385_00710 [Tateyamaria omphalii]